MTWKQLANEFIEKEEEKEEAPIVKKQAREISLFKEKREEIKSLITDSEPQNLLIQENKGKKNLSEITIFDHYFNKKDSNGTPSASNSKLLLRDAKISS